MEEEKVVTPPPKRSPSKEENCFRTGRIKVGNSSLRKFEEFELHPLKFTCMVPNPNDEESKAKPIKLEFMNERITSAWSCSNPKAFGVRVNQLDGVAITCYFPSTDESNDSWVIFFPDVEDAKFEPCLKTLSSKYNVLYNYLKECKATTKEKILEEFDVDLESILSGKTNKGKQIAKPEESEEEQQEEENVPQKRHNTRATTQANSAHHQEKEKERGKILCYYKNVCITQGDVERLNEGEFLNDSLIDWYLQRCYDRIKEQSYKDKVHIFSTQFYPLLKKDPERAAQRVPLPSKTKIFEKDFLFIPVNENAHWTLFVVCYPGKDNPYNKKTTDMKQPTCIMNIDSLGSSHRTASRKIREYLSLRYKVEYNVEKKFDAENIPGMVSSVPGQDNHCDCGVFLLHYVDLFCEQMYKLPIPLNNKEWFELSDIPQKRKRMREIIMHMNEEQQDKLKEQYGADSVGALQDVNISSSVQEITPSSERSLIPTQEEEYEDRLTAYENDKRRTYKFHHEAEQWEGDYEDNVMPSTRLRDKLDDFEDLMDNGPKVS
jgi:sentrin-specific protease 7